MTGPGQPPALVELIHYGASYSGGFLPMIRAALDEARARGWETRLVLSQAAAGKPWLPALEEAYPGTEVVRIKPRRDATAELGRLLAGHDGPTVLHSHFTGFDIPSAGLGRRRPDTVVAWHMHSHLEPGARARLANFVKFATYGRAVRTALCVGPEIGRSLERRGFPKGRTEFFPNAIDFERFSVTDDSSRQSARSELGVGDDRPVILHFGWDWRRKGGDLLLDAVVKLRDDGTDVLVLTAGAGEAALTAAAERGLDEGIVRTLEPRQDIETLYAAADAFASPSRAEGMPLSMAEAIATGLPVVASDIPGQAAIGSDLPGCRIVPLEPDGIALALRDVTGLGRPTAADLVASRDVLAERMGLGAWATRLIDRFDQAVRSTP